MGYVSDSELERMRFDSSSPNKAHCLSILYKLIGYSLTVQAICLCTTYVILVECMHVGRSCFNVPLNGRRRHAYYSLSSAYACFSLFCATC
jgi:hypothetical protein